MRSAHPIAVCVSGAGTNLRALRDAERRGGELGAQIALVIADRPCPALDFAEKECLPRLLLSPARFDARAEWDRAVCDALVGAGVRLVVLAGFMRVLGAPTLEAFHGRILNVHPSLLPAFPGRDAVGDALAAGVRVTGVTVHLVDESLDGGPILLQEPVHVMPDDHRASLLARIHEAEHRLLPRAVATHLGIERRVRRALISVSDKRGVAELGAALSDLGFGIVSTGGTARVLREAGVPVTDVSAVTGSPEMLDGRVKTLHPRIAAGILADLRRPDHVDALASAGIDSIELVVVNLYPFAEAAARHGAGGDEVIEEIDIGGPTLVRAAAKNSTSVTVVTDPADYPSLVDALRSAGGVPEAMRRDLAGRAFAHTAAYDTTIAAVLPRILGDAASEELVDSVPNVLPERLTVTLERAADLRYGENPHQRAALYRRTDVPGRYGPFARGAQPLQGKPLSYNNILDASAAAAICRDLRGAAAIIVKHTNPCGAAEADTMTAAWEAALAADRLSAFGGVVALRGNVDRALALELIAIFLEVVVAVSFDPGARDVLAARPNLRLIADPGLLEPVPEQLELRSAGGGFLATTADRLETQDAPHAWRQVSMRGPAQSEVLDLDLAWRVARHVSSNAIVLARNRSVVGVGAGQMSRVDSARLAVERAGPERARGASAASDAFFPFSDGVQVLLDAGVCAIVQPGGSQHDAEVIAAVDRASGSMLLTGRRHFRH